MLARQTATVSASGPGTPPPFRQWRVDQLWAWLSSGSPQAACASWAQALEDTVAMPAVTRIAHATCPGAISAADDAATTLPAI